MKFTEAGLLPLGEGTVRTTTVIGAGTVHRLGSQEARSKEGILSIRHHKGQRGCCARKKSRQGRAHATIGGRWCRVKGQLGRSHRTGDQGSRVRERGALQTGGHQKTRRHPTEWSYQNINGPPNAVLVSILRIFFLCLRTKSNPTICIRFTI